MMLKETIEELKKWSATEQVEFCNRISQNITIGIRGILSYDDETKTKKLEAIKWLNEFHHRINNLKFNIEKATSQSNNVEEIANHAKYYASKNEMSKGYIYEAIRHSTNEMKRKEER